MKSNFNSKTLSGYFMKRNKLLISLLLTTPILFFWGHRFLQMIFPPENPESFISELIGAVMSGYGGSIGFWMLYRKVSKNQERKESDDLSG
jgi:hypothetical protein